MRIVDHPSPNCEEREGQKVDMLVMHYTGMKSMQEARDRLCDGAAEKRVSSHYLVDEDGTIYRLVPEDKRAWHAGKSAWRGHSNINQRSIGIEIVNPGHEFGYCPFPAAQMEAVAQLSKDIIARHAIPSWNVVAHSDIAPGRKSDPGELFDWKMLAEQGIGVMPPIEDKFFLSSLIETPMKWVTRLFSSNVTEALTQGASGPAVAAMQAKLGAYGYPILTNGTYDEPTKQAVIAFQRHFRPSHVDGVWNEECAKLLQGLLKRVPAVTTPGPDSRMAAC